MNEQASDIAQEFLTSPDPRRRRNALTFLRAIGTPEAVRMLVDRAVGPDETLREAAAAEMLLMEDASRASAVKALRALGTHHDPAVRNRAYLLLARAGSTLGGDLRFGERLARAWRAHDQVYPSRNFLFYLQSLPSVLLGWLLASIGLLFYLAITVLSRFTERGEFIEIVLWGAVAALLVAGAATWRTTAFRYHADDLAGVLVECGPPLAAAVAAVVLFLVAAVLQDTLPGDTSGSGTGTSGIDIQTVLAAGAIVGVMASAIRLATILTRLVAHRRTMNYLVSLLSGGFVGSLAVSAAALAAPRGPVDAYWPVLILVAFGVAAGFAGIEARASDDVPQRIAPWSRVIAAGIAFIFLGSAALPLVGRGAGEVLSPTSPVRSVSQLPYAISFMIAQKDSVLFATQDRRDEDLDLQAALFDSSQRLVEGASGDDPPAFQATLEPGAYTVRIGKLGEVADSGVNMATVFTALQRLAGYEPLPPEPETITPPLQTALMVTGDLPETTYRKAPTNPAYGEPIPVSSVPFVRHVDVQEPRTLFLNLKEVIPPPYALVPRLFSTAGKEVLPEGYGFNAEFKVDKGEYVVVVDAADSPKLKELLSQLGKPEIKVKPAPTIPGTELIIGTDEETTFAAPRDVTAIGDAFTETRTPVERLPLFRFIDVEGTGRQVRFAGPTDLWLRVVNASGQEAGTSIGQLVVELSPGRYLLEAAPQYMESPLEWPRDAAIRVRTVPAPDDATLHIAVQ